MRTVGFIVCLCSHIYSTGKAVILDISFCLLKGIIEIRTLFFLQVLLSKKRRYCTSLVPGDAIDNNFSTKDVGEIDIYKEKLYNHH